MNTLTTITHALSDPTRVRLLAACLDRERCVCQLVELIGLSNASISKHLSMLKAGGLLVNRRDGRWVHYQTPPSPTGIVADALTFVRTHGLHNDTIQSDIARLAQIEAIKPCDLARMQREGCCCVPQISSAQTTQEILQ